MEEQAKKEELTYRYGVEEFSSVYRRILRPGYLRLGIACLYFVLMLAIGLLLRESAWLSGFCTGCLLIWLLLCWITVKRQKKAMTAGALRAAESTYRYVIGEGAVRLFVDRGGETVKSLKMPFAEITAVYDLPAHFVMLWQNQMVVFRKAELSADSCFYTDFKPLIEKGKQARKKSLLLLIAVLIVFTLLRVLLHYL